jgi:carbonic anhydrase/acetyltransferase-like protein (isoleucine patch superfamily)
MLDTTNISLLTEQALLPKIAVEYPIANYPIHHQMIKPFRDSIPKIHETAFVAEDAVIIGDVEIGSESSVWFGSIIRGDVNHIRIGERTNIQDATVIHVSSKDHATILEDEITVGHRVTLHGCYVEKCCLIGIGSIILDGARIGRNSLVAAGCLVTPATIIPPESLVMGAPARVKRPLTSDELDNLNKSWQNYVELSRAYLSANG